MVASNTKLKREMLALMRYYEKRQWNWKDAMAEKCGERAAPLIPRWGMYFSCVLPKGHEGEHQQGGHCYKHGDYVGKKCSQFDCEQLTQPSVPAPAEPQGDVPDMSVRIELAKKQLTAMKKTPVQSCTIAIDVLETLLSVYDAAHRASAQGQPRARVTDEDRILAKEILHHNWQCSCPTCGGSARAIAIYRKASEQRATHAGLKLAADYVRQHDNLGDIAADEILALSASMQVETGSLAKEVKIYCEKWAVGDGFVSGLLQVIERMSAPAQEAPKCTCLVGPAMCALHPKGLFAPTAPQPNRYCAGCGRPYPCSSDCPAGVLTEKSDRLAAPPEICTTVTYSDRTIQIISEGHILSIADEKGTTFYLTERITQPPLAAPPEHTAFIARRWVEQNRNTNESSQIAALIKLLQQEAAPPALAALKARLEEAEWWEHIAPDCGMSTSGNPDCIYCQRLAELRAAIAEAEKGTGNGD